MRSSGWALPQDSILSSQKWDFGDRQAHRENVRWRWSQRSGIFLQAKKHQMASKPPEARVGSRQVLPPRPKKEPRLQTAWCWASGLRQNWDKFLLFTPLFVVPCYDSKLIHLHYKLIQRNQNEVIKDTFHSLQEVAKLTVVGTTAY